jgi:hypothetical protein
VVAAVGAFAWFMSRLGPDVVFGPWQGPLLSAEPLQTVPLLSAWIAAALDALPTGNPAWRLNVLSAAFGATGCGMIAALVTRVGKAWATPVEATATGLAAAAVFATASATTYAATGAGPGTLSSALGLAALLLVVTSVHGRRRFPLRVLAAVAAGLATANHPAFALLLPLLWAIHLRDPRGAGVLPGTLLLTVAFAVTAGLPLAAALYRGESLVQFLGHALSSPYPTVGDGRPQLGYAQELARNMALPALLLAVPALVLFFGRGTRPYMLLLGAVFLTMGPFLPFLTNQHVTEGVLRDAAAPRLMTLAAASAFAALGLLALLWKVSDTRRARPRRLAILLALTLVVVSLQRYEAPDRGHTLARALGEQILAGCPEEAYLVTGNPNLSSLVVATQRALGVRPDVKIVPAEFLTRPRLRDRLQRHLDNRLSIPARFPAEDAFERWEAERPFVLREMLRTASEVKPDNPYMRDLAMWDLVRDNPERWPLCFVGVNSSWLTARAQLSGPVFVYPRNGEGAEVRLYELAERVALDEEYRLEPGIGHAFADLLLPISELLRNQGGGLDAEHVAVLADAVQPDFSSTTYALARATARQGKNELAAAYARKYAAREQASLRQQQNLLEAVKSDLRSNVLIREFRRIVELEQEGKAPEGVRAELTERMWDEDAVFPLAQGLQAIVAHKPGDLDALYQGAAAMAQVGSLDEAARLLRKAAEINAVAIYERVNQDRGRFALLQAHIRRNLPVGVEPVTSARPQGSGSPTV